MAKITVILGGTFGLYNGKGLFREIEKEFSCSIRRVSPNKLETRVKEVSLEFYICNSPIRDRSYDMQKEYLETVWKEIMPPPANEVVKEIKNSDAVLFFGYCGTLQGRKSIYTPEKFKEIFFEGGLMSVNEKRIKVENELRVKNILRGKIKAENATVITSNLTLAPLRNKPESKDKIIRLSGLLSEFGDIVEKETYQIVKYFGSKVPLGIYLQSSDVLTNRRHMLSEKGMETDKNRFNRNGVKGIKIAMESIKH